jgi:hypothetical protein
MEFGEVIEYYSRPLVRKEISDYCQGRWVAIECVPQGEGRFFLRYWRKDGPLLSISRTQDIGRVLHRFGKLKPRTLYGSVNVYSRLETVEDTEEESNIAHASPIWDIDGHVERWRETMQVADIIVRRLEAEGVSKSVFVNWSGRGAHVHMHEKAFSKDLLAKHNPLDVAYSVVEYVCRLIKQDLIKVSGRLGEQDLAPKVENKIDLKRVFTAPLSLHRELGLCAVCLKPDQIGDFDIDWARPQVLKHNEAWREHVEGEGDQLAEKALAEVGTYWATVQPRSKPRRERRPTQAALETRAPKRGKIGRFQVMALLQAARYFILMGEEEKAKSFGLNRAIFYTWAKRRGVAKPPPRRTVPSGQEVARERREGKTLVYIGNEGAYTSEEGWYIIGEESQLPQDYDKQIVSKIDPILPYERAWSSALEYLRDFPRSDLLDQSKFFSEVYRPVRDGFLEEVVKRKAEVS